jgi:hypothetical protein
MWADRRAKAADNLLAIMTFAKVKKKKESAYSLTAREMSFTVTQD